jgi:signal transduction histidine kinase
LIDAAAARGVDPAELTAGVPYSLEHLRRRRNWIDWASFAVLLGNAGRQLSREQLEEIGESMIRARAYRPLFAIAGLLPSPASFIAWMSSSGARGSKQFFRCVDATCERIGPNEIELVQQVAEGYANPPEFWIVSRSVQRAIPRIFGQPEADVEMEAIERGTRMRIRYREGGSLGRRVGSWLGRTLISKGAKRELKEAYEELQRRCDDLDQQARARAAAEQANAQWAEKIENAQRLESLAVLAGGVAHDFDNLLVGILGNAEILQASLADDPRAGGAAREIVSSARAASDLTHQLLAYAGKARVTVETVELAELVRQTFDMVRSGVARGAILEHARGHEEIWTEADATQLRQVLMNLIANAVESVSDATPIVSVRTGSVQAERSYLDRFQGGGQLPEGLYALVEVSDNGRGMPDEVRERIFDPFYTTKAQGRGLGLAATQGIIAAHAGAIAVQTAPDQGTEFRILLPTTLPSPEKGAADPAPIVRGHGTILVVDDEATVRRVAEKMLRRLGFEVITVDGGQGAVRTVRRDPAAIRAVLLDVTMPGMDGHATFAALRQLAPSLPILVMSGYAEHEGPEALGEPAVDFLPKPFTTSGLSSRLATLLED